jgi:hypothetical protein
MVAGQGMPVPKIAESKETHMAQSGWGNVGGVLCAMVGLLGFDAGQAASAEVEARDFTITVDGKRAGDYRMNITRQDDGSLVMTGQADVRVTFLKIYHTTYAYRGTEVWKNGRLFKLDSSTNDDGTRYVVNAVADGENLRVKVNGQERLVRGDVWVTSYWHLAQARFRNQAVPLLDVDSGKEINGTLQLVGNQSLTVAGVVQSCTHYRVTGGVTADLWYDAQERLVRQEWMEKNLRCVLELNRIRK